jgi:phage baseplate assembly protein W
MAIRLRNSNVIDTRPDIAVGVAYPFSSNGGSLFTLNYTTKDQAISNLKNLLLTRKGERYMLPSFGSRIPDFLFEQITDDALADLESSISADIAFWLPYINVTKVDVAQNQRKENLVTIKIDFSVGADNANTSIILNIGPDQNIILQ